MDKIMEAIAEQIAQSPAASKAMIIGLFFFIGLLGRFFYKLLIKFYRSIMKEFKLSNFKIEAMDTALEHSLKNGYANARDKKFNELKDNDNFINEN